MPAESQGALVSSQRGLQPHTWVKVAGSQGDFEQGVTRTGSWACSFALTQATLMPTWHIAGSSVSKSSLVWKNAGWAVGKFTEYLASILAATVSSSFPAKLASGQGCLRPLCSDCSCMRPSWLSPAEFHSALWQDCHSNLLSISPTSEHCPACCSEKLFLLHILLSTHPQAYAAVAGS